MYDVGGGDLIAGTLYRPTMMRSNHCITSEYDAHGSRIQSTLYHPLGSPAKAFCVSCCELHVLSCCSCQVIDIELPITLKVKVVQTDPGIKGDTAGGGTCRAVQNSEVQGACLG